MFDQMQSRDLKLRELFSLSFTLFSKKIIPILLITCIIFIPIDIVFSIVFPHLDQNMEVLFSSIDISQEQALLALDNAQIYILVLFLIETFFTPIGLIAIAKLVKNEVFGEESSVKLVLLQTIEKTPAIILGGIMYSIYLFLASFAFFLPAIYFGVAYTFYLYCIGLSDKKGAESLGCSRALVKGKWWATFGIIFLLTMIMWMIQYGIGIVLMGGNGVFILDVISEVVISFSQCYVYVFMTLWYLNRDCQKNPEHYQKYKKEVILTEDLK